MSQLTNKGKLITRFEISFDNETKADIDTLKAKIDELTRALSVKNDNHGDRLLAAMRAEAANDAPQPDAAKLKEITALERMIKNGNAYLKKRLSNNGACKVTENTQKEIDRWEMELSTLKLANNVPVMTAPSEADNSRETINDVDYLSGSDLDECVPHIDDVLDQPNWLSESVPQITQADMQLIFIKNLSETLIQRMHSMNRFSEDDYAIGGDKLMAWDILIYEPLNSYAVLIGNRQKPKIADLLVFWDTGAAADANWNTDSGAFAMLRTITEAELPAFRAALEACYA